MFALPVMTAHTASPSSVRGRNAPASRNPRQRLLVVEDHLAGDRNDATPRAERVRPNAVRKAPTRSRVAREKLRSQK